MGETFEGWTSWVEDAYLLCTPEDPECLKHHYITRTEKDEPQYTVEEEIAMMNEQIENSEGFDIDFSLFRCLFNYHLVDPDDIDFVEEPETNGDLMKRLSKESLNVFNKEDGMEFEFVKVVKANFHYSAGFMFLITFQVLDPSDNQEKLFQARVRYSTRFPAEYVFCRPRPEPEVDSDHDTSEEDVKGI
ncbi:Cystatin-related plant [Arabidopsis thaliana x Arabidopsis arenosa]|uniref:Cystatin-related plant n=1 Tax=Arabidopsis thaliana x Arabidopsis arenosa TaxID=1240361 RepID=A0A8T2BI30_9BRAS|nr:Cystatin-related plant [Arabidopsis thaliana x Arabidopsis arenosa]